MKNVLKVDFQKKTIIMDRTFAKNCADTRSEEYAHLQRVRADYLPHRGSERGREEGGSGNPGSL